MTKVTLDQVLCKLARWYVLAENYYKEHLPDDGFGWLLFIVWLSMVSVSIVSIVLFVSKLIL